jgi:3-oxoadipate CoA-transferase beta subunit
LATLACTPQGLEVIDMVDGLSLEELSALIGLPLKAV